MMVIDVVLPKLNSYGCESLLISCIPSYKYRYTKLFAIMGELERVMTTYLKSLKILIF